MKITRTLIRQLILEELDNKPAHKYSDEVVKKYRLDLLLDDGEKTEEGLALSMIDRNNGELDFDIFHKSQHSALDALTKAGLVKFKHRLFGRPKFIMTDLGWAAVGYID
tara:strand:+ start:255 stop:581 length:327 start_codon:yes stop_codon:yes gene_type:complete